MTKTLQPTAMAELHRQAGAKMVPFAGWDMPVQYQGVRQEHEAVRTRAGIFDLSHMGEIEFRGGGAAEFVQQLVTNDVNRVDEFQAQYTCMTNEAGKVLDDMLVYRFPDRYWLVVNASNRLKVFDWISQHKPPEVEVVDLSLSTSLIAVQGPASEELLQPLVEADLSGLGYYRFLETRVNGVQAVVSRTGYTGEDGFEIYLDWDAGPALWSKLSAIEGLLPIGLGARDTLRLEAGYALYGNELSEDVTPLDVGLGWVVKLDTGFLGSEALARHKEAGPTTTITGFEMEGRQIPRGGYPVFAEGRQVGQVTSGTFSPSLKKGVGLALVEKSARAAGTSVEIEIRGRRQQATIARPPFVRGSVKR